MLYDSTTQKGYSSIEEFLVEHKDTSFGDLRDTEYLASIGLHFVIPEIKQYDSELEYLSETGLEQRDGKWYRTYSVQPLNISEDQRKAIKIRRIEAALDAHFDSVAGQRRYRDRVTCTLRAGYPGPFQAEGQAFAGWMDTCNHLAYQIMAEVLAGTRPEPTNAEAFIALLPEMVWP